MIETKTLRMLGEERMTDALQRALAELGCGVEYRVLHAALLKQLGLGRGWNLNYCEVNSCLANFFMELRYDKVTGLSYVAEKERHKNGRSKKV